MDKRGDAFKSKTKQKSANRAGRRGPIPWQWLQYRARCEVAMTWKASHTENGCAAPKERNTLHRNRVWGGGKANQARLTQRTRSGQRSEQRSGVLPSKPAANAEAIAHLIGWYAVFQLMSAKCLSSCAFISFTLQGILIYAPSSRLLPWRPMSGF